MNPYTFKQKLLQSAVSAALSNGYTTDVAIFNPYTPFNNAPMLCRLMCGQCLNTFCGSWRNDWLLRKCDECGVFAVAPVIDDLARKTMQIPYGKALN